MRKLCTFLIIQAILLTSVIWSGASAQDYTIVDTIIPAIDVIDYSNVQTPDDSLVLYNRITDKADYMRVLIQYYDGVIDSGIIARHELVKANETVYISSVRLTIDPVAGYTINPHLFIAPDPDPFDVNRDGSVNFGDLYSLTAKLFRW